MPKSWNLYCNREKIIKCQNRPRNGQKWSNWGRNWNQRHKTVPQSHFQPFSSNKKESVLLLPNLIDIMLTSSFSTKVSNFKMKFWAFIKKPHSGKWLKITKNIWKITFWRETEKKSSRTHDWRSLHFDLKFGRFSKFWLTAHKTI